jgi:hypothetical protein
LATKKSFESSVLMDLARDFRHEFPKTKADLIYTNKCQAIKNGMISRKISSLTNTKIQQQENNFSLDWLIKRRNYYSNKFHLRVLSNNQLLRKF